MLLDVSIPALGPSVGIVMKESYRTCGNYIDGWTYLLVLMLAGFVAGN